MSVSTSREAGLFGALDLRNPPVMDGELHDAEAEAFNFFADQSDPIRGDRGG